MIVLWTNSWYKYNFVKLLKSIVLKYMKICVYIYIYKWKPSKGDFWKENKKFRVW